MAYDMNQNEALEALARVTPQWLAGFFDGEGNISVFRNPRVYSFHVVIGQSEPKILALISCVYGGVVSDRVVKGRRQFAIRWCGKSALPVLEAIKDYVICKRRQVEAAIELAKLHNEEGGRTRVSDEETSKREKFALVIVDANHGIDTRVCRDENLGGVR